MAPARPEDVRRLQEEGCAVLCLDCPEGILFGIDYSAWTVGPRFMGVKLVPPGLHYVYCSPSGEEVGSFRTGFFLTMKPRDVAVFRWDPETEELAPLADQDEEARYADGVRSFDFDGHLGPYPLELSAQWEELTRYATDKLVRKIEPVSGAVRSKRAEYDKKEGKGAQEEDDEANELPNFDDLDDGSAAKQQSKQQEQKQQEDQDSMKVDPQATLESNAGSGNLFFSTVPRARKKVGASPEETTRLHLDRTAQLDDMVAREYGGDSLGILGELQLAYIAFILGQNYDGYDQWRALLQLLCSCESAVSARPEMFAELLRAFFAQLSQAPSDLFEDDLTSGNFLGGCAISLLDVCDTEASPPKLRKRCSKLRELVQEKFGISTDDLALMGEDAPVVVDAEGRDLIDLAAPSLVGMD
eukprot:TRINITY_DN32551_c0_g1_i1.p1 TRINITY_DN32551_c0_g1~~TRINITY_DN32551_c0_g1_i1.p1  ORF type:complete len:431 (+),score=86.71 TRINITY_DN32551_c0_g1_i1:54-1295(+)